MSEARNMIRRMPLAFDAEAAADLYMIVQYNIADPMHVVIADGHCRVEEGPAENPDVTLTIRDELLVKLITGQMRGITAFVTGKLKVEGNPLLAQKLQQLFDRRRLACP